MTQILIVESSPRGLESASRKLTEKLRQRLLRQYPNATVIERDLARNPIPHLDQQTLRALSTKDPSEAESLKEFAQLSDTLIVELQSSDLVVIASPMWNFGIPSSLKAWIDHVVRAGKTFRYVPDGVEGLAKGKRAILALASGGVFTEGPWMSWDSVEPYLRQVLGFIGITDIQTVRAQGMNISALAAMAVPNGERQIEELSV